jgi:hypothetical protein
VGELAYSLVVLVALFMFGLYVVSVFTYAMRTIFGSWL